MSRPHHRHRQTARPHPGHQTCENCHDATFTQSWTNVRMDHSSAPGICVNCHNGLTQPGKPPNHVATANTCDDCHVTTRWSDVRFDHIAVTATCITCHSVGNPWGNTSKADHPSGHMPTTNTCEDCHISTTSFATVLFSHAAATGVCSSCHFTGNPWGVTGPGHSPRGECDGCHNTTSFK
ncbi:MAG: cytochrome c3 family protein [Paracoccaceae bacterium]